MKAKFFCIACFTAMLLCSGLSGCNHEETDNATATTTSAAVDQSTSTSTLFEPSSTSSVSTSTVPDNASTTSTSTEAPPMTTTSTVAAGVSINPLEPLPAPQSAREELVFGINTYGFEEYKLLSKHNIAPNFVLSPYSISNCLAMVYAGAKNNTQQQMAAALHYTLPRETLPGEFGSLTLDMLGRNNADNGSDYSLTLKIANSAWLQTNYVFLSSYTDMLQADFNAGPATVDFKADPEGARQIINAWASDNTAGKIPEVLPQGIIDDMIRIVLVNTVYFKGSWLAPFIESMTHEAPFHLVNGSTKNIQMMYKTGYYPYVNADGFQAVALPYHHKGDLSLLVVVPDAGNLAQFEEEITAGGLYAIAHSMKPDLLSLGLPKFKARTHRSMKQDLLSLGMIDAFSENADLSGIDGNGNLPEKLYLAFVEHESMIDVNEKGTEAAAATAAGGGGSGGPGPEPIPFIIDRPFIFAIYDSANQTVLFLGRILDPSQQAE